MGAGSSEADGVDIRYRGRVSGLVEVLYLLCESINVVIDMPTEILRFSRARRVGQSLMYRISKRPTGELSGRRCLRNSPLSSSVSCMCRSTYVLDLRLQNPLLTPTGPCSWRLALGRQRQARPGTDRSRLLERPSRNDRDGTKLPHICEYCIM